jgi:hypothetical protein
MTVKEKYLAMIKEGDGRTPEYLTRQILTEEEAIELGKGKFWEDLTPGQAAIFQLFQELLSMPFELFHKGMGEALGRPVWTHEFAFSEHLKDEYLKKRKPPTLDEIINWSPAEETIVAII